MESLVKCYLCNAPMLLERVIDGKLEKVLHPEHDETEFFINNGSRMPVIVCLSCQKSADLNSQDVHQTIMNNVIDGWKQEQNYLVEKKHISRDRADFCIAEHSKLKIKFKSQGLNDYQIKVRDSK